MSLPTLPVACRASSFITSVPASLYRRQETHGFSGDYFCHWMVMASKWIADSRTWKNPQNPCGPRFVGRPILKTRDCQSCQGPAPTNAAVSDHCDVIVMPRLGFQKCRNFEIATTDGAYFIGLIPDIDITTW